MYDFHETRATDASPDALDNIRSRALDEMNVGAISHGAGRLLGHHRTMIASRKRSGLEQRAFRCRCVDLRPWSRLFWTPKVPCSAGPQP